MLEEIIELLNNPLTNLAIAAIIGVLTNVITAKLFDKAKKSWWSAKSDLLNSLSTKPGEGQLTTHPRSG